MAGSVTLPQAASDHVPVEPLMAVLTAAIVANLALMLAVLVAPRIRRRQAAISELRAEKAEARRSARRDTIRSGRALVVASAPEAPADAVAASPDDWSPDDPSPTGPRPGSTGPLDETTAEDDLAEDDLAWDDPGDERGSEGRTMSSRPDAIGPGQPRRFPVVLHQDPHAGRTIEAFLSSLDAPEEVGPDGAVDGSTEGPPDDVVFAPDGLLDPLTGLDGPLAWERSLRDEDARLARYRRPTTVVIGELDGLRRLTDRFGTEPAQRLLPAVGAAFRREARRSDRVARLGWACFAVLLPETDEVQAINYVERVRASCDRWLESGAIALRLSIGWASPSGSGGLEPAMRIAEQRMYAERRHAGLPPSIDPAATGTDGRP